MHEPCDQGAKGDELLAMHRLALVGLQSFGHSAEHGDAHLRGMKHHFPKGIFVNSEDAAVFIERAGNVGGAAGEQWDLSERTAGAVDSNGHERPV